MCIAIVSPVTRRPFISQEASLRARRRHLLYMDVRMPRSHGCERAAMPPTVTVATMPILTIIELFIG